MWDVCRLICCCFLVFWSSSGQELAGKIDPDQTPFEQQAASPQNSTSAVVTCPQKLRPGVKINANRKVPHFVVHDLQ
jgi:hypothetical protein